MPNQGDILAYKSADKAFETGEAASLPDGSTAHTQSPGDNTTKIATTAFVDVAAGATNPMTTLGDTVYENSTPAPDRLPGNISGTKKFLTQTGTGAVSAAPAWGTIATGDVPTLNQDTSGTAANVSGTPALPNGTTATTQSALDSSTKLATTAYADNAVNAVKPNPASCVIVEDFVGGSTTAGAIGQNGWFFDAIGSTPTFTSTAPAVPNLGIIQFNTAAAATQGQGGGMRLISLASTGCVVNNLQSNIGWELQWIFKLSQTTATRFRIGIGTGDTVIVLPNGLSCRYDTNATFADTTFVFESTNSSAVTTVDSGIAVDTNWHRVKITSLVSGTAIFTLYDAAGIVQATKSLAISFTTTAGMSPVIILATDATAQKSCQLDYMSFYFPGLAR